MENQNSQDNKKLYESGENVPNEWIGEADIADADSMDRNNINLPTEKRKSAKGLVFLIIGSAIALQIIAIAAGVFVPKIRYNAGMSVVEKYAQDKIEYDKAMEKIQKFIESDKEEYATGAQEAKRKLEKLKSSKEHFESGEVYKNKNEYYNAIYHYRLVDEIDTNYAAAQNAISELIPYWKEELPGQINELLAEGNTEEANKRIGTFLTFETDKDIYNIQRFLVAEEFMGSGCLNQAQEIYRQLPVELVVNGVSVQQRMDLLSQHSVFVAMCGKWKTTAYSYETKESWDSGRWYAWNSEGGEADRYLKVVCLINGDGTVTVKTNVEFLTFTNYNSVQSSLKVDILTSECTQNIPYSLSTVSMDFSAGSYSKGGVPCSDSQNITFNGSHFTHSFKMIYPYSRSCDEIYTSNTTFGARVEAY